nr:retrovirus-related Pol polyprotein from transposon TNT 1-94 [Tanacetum cinerariifolium]
DRFKSGERYHVVPPPYTGTFMSPKLDLVFHDAPTINETVLTLLNVEPILTRSRLVPLTTSRLVTTAVPQTKVQHQRPTKHGITKAHSPVRRPINLRPSPTHSNFHQKVCAVKATQVNVIQGVKGNWGNPQHDLKDKGVINSGCSRHMIGNISYLSDFEEINREYVAFGGNPKGGKIIGLESVEARIVVYQQNENVFEVDIKLLKLDVMLRENALVELRKKFEKAEQERDYLKLKLDKFQTSSKNLNVSMPASPVYDRYKSEEGYHAVPPPYIGTFMPPKPDLVFHDAPTVNATVPTVEPSTTKPNKDLSQPSVKPVEHPISANNLRKHIPKSRGHRYSWNRKACFVCKSLTHLIKDYDYYEKKMVQQTVRNHAIRGNHQYYARMTHPNPHRHIVPTTVLTRSRLVPLNVARPITIAVPQTKVHHERPNTHGVPKAHSPSRRPINLRSSPSHNYVSRHTSAFKQFDYTDALGRSKFSWVFFLATKDETSTILKTFLTGIENQLNLKVKIIRSDNGTEFKNQDLNQFCRMKGIKREFSVPRTPQQNGIAKRKNKTLIKAARTMLADSLLPILFWAEAVNTACYVQNRVLVTKPHNKTPYELLLGRTPSVGFMRPFRCPMTILNTLDPLSKFDGKADEGFLVGYSNTDNDATFEVKEHESTVHVSPNSCDKTKKHDGKTKREAKGKSHVELSTGVRNLSEEFKDFSSDSTNGDTAANMPALEDITYSDDEKDVGAEADFSNLETNITVSPSPTTRVHKDHPVTQIIGDLSSAPQTRSMTRMVKEHGGPTQINNDDFHTFMNKKDERGIVVRNKALLLAEGHTQEEGIDYKEAFFPVERIEAIRLFLAYTSFMGFMVYQIDVKSVFLYGTIEKEVYICQPLGFEDPDYPDKVYKVVKALYGLHQAPRAWYETLANYLLENGFQRGKIDQTLFIKKQKGNILLVQVYVVDIIFGSTNKDLCKAFEKLMKDKFQMSSMGELTFFLGLQVKHKQDEIFIIQDKYVAEILRKFGLTDGKLARTPIDTEKPLLKDPDGQDTNVHIYRSMIGSLMYLTSSRPDVMFAICACVRFKVTPKASYLHAVKRIFRYLKGKPHLGLWYPKDSPFNLVAYSDSDYAGANLDRNSTTGGCQFLGYKVSVVGGRKLIINEDTLRQALQLDDADSIDCLPNEEIFAQLARMGYEKSSTKVGKGLSGVDTPLIEGMLVPHQVNDDVADVVANTAEPTLPSPTTTPPPLQQELIPSTSQCKITQALDITKLKQRVRRLEKKNVVTAAAATSAATIITAALMPAASAARRRKGVVIRDPKKIATPSVIVHSEPKSKDKGKGILVEEPKPLKKKVQIEQDEAYTRELEAELNANINWNEVIEQVKRKEKQDNTVMRYQALKRKPQTKAQARKNTMVYLKNIAGFKMDFFKGMTYNDIRPIFERHFNYIVAFLEKREEELEEEASKQSKRKNETSKEKEAKKHKLDKEVPVIDYQVYTEHNKPYYKIVRADGTHQLFLSFIRLLRNFDREDLKMLWKIFQERFASSEPKNFSDDFLLNTLKTMFEKPDVKVSIWKSKSGKYGLAKDKRWELLKSCGVHIITFITTQMILLVERRYPLTRFTLDQMLNIVRLEVEEENFKEYTLRDYYCWLKTYCCRYKLKLLDNAADTS